MSVFLEEVIVSMDLGEPVIIPNVLNGSSNPEDVITEWILNTFDLKVNVSPDFCRAFSGVTETVREKTFVIKSLHNHRHEGDVFTKDPERQKRRILMVTEVLSVLKIGYLYQAMGTIRFWARGNSGELLFLGIRSEHDAPYLFTEKPANRLLRPRTITIRMKK